MRLVKRLVFLIFLVSSFSAHAQVDFPVFKYGTEVNPADSQKISLNLYNLNYLHNTEWFSEIPLSGTLFGYEIIPEIQYQPLPKFVLKAGLYLQQEFGRARYTTVAPTFTAKYQARRSAFIFGTLEGSTNHGFVEPLYDYAWLINKRLENGFQILTKTKHYDHDLYINWRKAIHPGDDFKEELDVGYSARVKFVNTDKWSVDMPIQFIYSHAGSQFQTDGSPWVSLANTAIGPAITYKNDGGWIKRVHFDNYYVRYMDASKDKRQPYKSGNGFLSHLMLNFGDFSFDLRYWNADKFITARGLSLFGSISEKDPDIRLRKRELLIGSFIYDKKIMKNLYFDLRLIPYYNFKENISTNTTFIKNMEYSYEMYIKYVMHFNLGKVKGN